MIRSIYFSPDTQPGFDLPPAQFADALEDKGGLLWVDFLAEPDESCEPILTGTFGFHPLAVDDALRETHTPKVDDWGSYLYIVLNAIAQERQNGLGIKVNELDIFLGVNFVVTHHDQPIAVIDEILAACRRDSRFLHDGPDHLLYKIIDHLVAGYMPLVEVLDQEIDEVEDQIFADPTPKTLERMFAMKRALLSMRRILTPQREVLNKLARDDYSVIDPRDRVFFRDIYDHLVRLHDLNESMRDLVSGALDSYLSVVNNRMNEVMKTLTIITTIFMPISFVVGFFGMNFFGPVMPGSYWTDRLMFGLTLAVVLLLPVSMFLWMRKRTWI